MKERRTFMGALALALLAITVITGLTYAQGPDPQRGAGVQASPVDTAFTYQGYLEAASGPLDSTCDFQFNLWDAAGSGSPPTGGTQIGTTQTRTTVTVTQGRFTIPDLDFGSNAFAGDARWLQIAVRCPTGSGTYTTLAPRQALTAAPYALYSRSTGALHGQAIATTAPTVNQIFKWDGSQWVPAADDDTTYAAGTGLNLDGTTFSVVTSTIQGRVTGACGAGYAIRQINADGSVVCEQDDDTGTTYNAGTGLNLDGTT